jgi:outer membrane receptor protein involved in Fe transport
LLRRCGKPETLAIWALGTLAIGAPPLPCNAGDASSLFAQSIRLSADIPAQPLADALAALARQTGLHIVYVSSVVRDKKSHSASSGSSASEALAQMLAGTGLGFEFLTPHSIRILEERSKPPDEGPTRPLEESPPKLQDVLVIGSRIPVPANVAATSPMHTVTRRDVQLAGHTDTVDVLSALPQMTSSAGADFGNHSDPKAAAGGITTVDLRGLRPQRTVVLINGKRLGVGDPNTSNATPAPDLDQIPLAMVERIEVMTGGASATYGSDAIAGVVNFVLRRDVEGVEIDGQYGFAQHTQQNDYLQGRAADAGFAAPSGSGIDGAKRTLSLIAGTKFHGGDGHVTGYFIYQRQDPVLGSDRDFSACTAVSNSNLSGNPMDAGVTCLGSPESNVFITQGGFGDAFAVDGHEFVPWPAAGVVPPSLFNTAPYSSSQRDDTRYQVGVLAHLDLTPSVNPYVELSFMQDATRHQIAPAGLFLSNNPITPDATYRVNCSNPLLSAQEAALLCTPEEIAGDAADPGSASAEVDIGRRNIEGGPRQFGFRHRSYRAVAGVNGELGNAWHYDAFALYHYTSLFQTYRRYFSFAAITRALQVTTGPSGEPVCISGGDCVPYDIFETGAVTPEQLAYLDEQGTDGGSNAEQIAEADVTGEFGSYGITLPWAHDGIAMNAGAEHRRESLRFDADAVMRSRDLSGLGPPPVALNKSVAINEGFIEVRMPVAQDRRWARDLSFDAGFRYSSYSTGGSSDTYKFDVQYAPVSDVRLRATYDRVIRVPSLIELFTPLSYNGSVGIATDPCAPTDDGATHAEASLAECQHTGITAAQYGNGIGPAFGGTNTVPQCPFECGVVTGGNAALAPETARTWSLGLTVTPTAVPALTGTIDYFHIRLEGAIGTVPEAVTLQQCLATGNPALCSQIVRTPAGGLSGANVADGGYILATSVNTSAALLSGIDVQADYRQRLGRWGALTESLTGTWLQHNIATPYRTAPSYECAGLFGNTCLNGSVNPKWRHNLRVSWETPWRMQLSLQWRFIGGTRFDNNSSQPLLQNQEEGFFDPFITRIADISYVDLSAVWTASRRMQLRAGVSNLFDKDPPFLPLDASGRAGNLNTFPVYDVLGRNVFVALHATF